MKPRCRVESIPNVHDIDATNCVFLEHFNRIVGITHVHHVKCIISIEDVRIVSNDRNARAGERDFFVTTHFNGSGRNAYIDDGETIIVWHISEITDDVEIPATRPKRDKSDLRRALRIRDVRDCEVPIESGNIGIGPDHPDSDWPSVHRTGTDHHGLQRVRNVNGADALRQSCCVRDRAVYRHSKCCSARLLPNQNWI